MYILFRFIYFLASIKLLSKSWWVFYYLDFFRKPIVFKNLDIAFPEKTKNEKIKIAKETYKNFLTFFEDAIEFNKDTQLFQTIEVKNENIILEAFDTNKPIILLTAHFGNWEIGSKFLYYKYHKPIAGVMREIDNPKINEFFKTLRGNEDIKLINRKKGAKEILRALIKEKRVLGILIDQYTKNSSNPIIKFFKPTSFNPAISKLAKSTGAIVIPFFVYKNDDKYIAEFQKGRIFDKNSDTIESFTQWQANVIEETIKRYPSEYYWFHNRWKS